jgi:uncharacterized protein YoxC
MTNGTLGRWNDDRLDDLKRRVDGVEPLVAEVARLSERMKSLSGKLDANTRATKEGSEATEHVARQLEKSRMEPLTRGRNTRTQIYIGLTGAAAAGIFALLGALVAGGHL